MLQVAGLLLGVLLVAAATGGALVQCGNKERRAKKRSVKSAKSAGRSAKRAVSKAGESAKEGAEFAKQKAKSKGRSAKRAVKSKAERVKAKAADAKKSAEKSARSSRRSRRSSRRSSLKEDAKQAANTVAAKARAAKDAVKEKLDNTQQSSPTCRLRYSKRPFEESEAMQQQQFVRAEPRALHFESQGGFQKVRLENPGTQRQAVKIKCSDNQLYRVSPVYAFVEAGNSLIFDVMRQNGAPKTDKLVFLTAFAHENAANPKGAFEAGSSTPNGAVVLPLLV